MSDQVENPIQVFSKYDTYLTKPYELLHDKTKDMDFTPSEDSDLCRHLPSLIRIFAVLMKRALGNTYPVMHSEDSESLLGAKPKL